MYWGRLDGHWPRKLPYSEQWPQIYHYLGFGSFMGFCRASLYLRSQLFYLYQLWKLGKFPFHCHITSLCGDFGALFISSFVIFSFRNRHPVSNLEFKNFVLYTRLSSSVWFTISTYPPQIPRQASLKQYGLAFLPKNHVV